MAGGGATSGATGSLALGNHRFTGVYSGSEDFITSDDYIIQTINKADTTSGVVFSVNPSVPWPIGDIYRYRIGSGRRISTDPQRPPQRSLSPEVMA